MNSQLLKLNSCAFCRANLTKTGQILTFQLFQKIKRTPKVLKKGRRNATKGSKRRISIGLLKPSRRFQKWFASAWSNLQLCLTNTKNTSIFWTLKVKKQLIHYSISLQSHTKRCLSKKLKKRFFATTKLKKRSSTSATTMLTSQCSVFKLKSLNVSWGVQPSQSSKRLWAKLTIGAIAKSNTFQRLTLTWKILSRRFQLVSEN